MIIFTIPIAVIAVSLILLVLFIFLLGYWIFLKNRQPVMTKKGTVMEVRSGLRTNPTMARSRENANLSTAVVRYEILFKADDGDEMILSAPYDPGLIHGMHGTLGWKGAQFEFFRLDD